MVRNADRRVTFSLPPEYQELVKKLAKRRRMNHSALVRDALDHYALLMGMRPIAHPVGKEIAGRVSGE